MCGFVALICYGVQVYTGRYVSSRGRPLNGVAYHELETRKTNRCAPRIVPGRATTPSRRETGRSSRCASADFLFQWFTSPRQYQSHARLAPGVTCYAALRSEKRPLVTLQRVTATERNPMHICAPSCCCTGGLTDLTLYPWCPRFVRFCCFGSRIPRLFSRLLRIMSAVRPPFAYCLLLSPPCYDSVGRMWRLRQVQQRLWLQKIFCLFSSLSDNVRMWQTGIAVWER